MKKLLASGLLAAVTVSAFGQGQITFNNRVLTATPPVDAKILDSRTGQPINGTDASYHAALIGGPTTATAASQSSSGTLSLLASPSTANMLVGFRTGALAGYVNVGTDSARDAGLPYSTAGLFQLVAWQGTETTWAQAYTDWKAGLIFAGWSNPLSLTTSTSATDPNVPTLQGLNSFSITGVPEPSSFALAGLGAAALLIFRRRK